MILDWRQWMAGILLAILAAQEGQAVTARAPTAFVAETGVVALERVTAPFPTLEAFLHDKEALKAYEKLLVQYYRRDKFPCDGFTRVLAQLRRWVDQEPALAERLWTAKPAAALSPLGTAPHYMRLPRLFHGIWEDRSRAGCSLSLCRPPTLAAPARWVAALEGTEILHTETAGKFTGSGMMVAEVQSGGKPMRLVTTAERGPALDAWAKSYGAAEPLVQLDAAGNVRSLSDRRLMGSAEGMAYRDPLAKKLVALLPERCERSVVDAFAVNAGKKVPGIVFNIAAVTGVSVAGAPAAGPPSPQAALKDVMKDLQIGGGKSGAANAPATIEIELRKKLKSAAEPRRRAEAALGLDLLRRTAMGDVGLSKGPSSAGSTPATRWALREALQDPSPQVRGQAALAISDAPTPVGGSSGGDRGNGGGSRSGGGLGPSIQRPLAIALSGALAAPDTVAIPGGPNLAPFAGPEGTQDRAFGGTIRNGLPVDPATKDKWWNDAKTAPVPETKDAAVERLTMDYLSHTKQSTSAEAFHELEERLRSQPELFNPVLKEVERKLEEVCDECKARNIVR